LFVISAVGSALAPDVNTFMLFRFIGGLSIGASSVVAPIYISEIAPPKYRGRMGISFQLNIVLGILVAYVSNYFLSGIPDDWRWMLGIVAIPAVLFFVLLFFTPETPRWLILHKDNLDEARKIIAYTDPEVDKAVDEIVQSKADQNGVQINSFRRNLKPLYSWLFYLRYSINFQGSMPSSIILPVFLR
jgi:MFS transporter, SP family, arabinose:H+ symporter